MKDTSQIKAEITNSIKNIPMLSSSASSLLNTVADSKHNLQDVVTIVKHDAALTANLLKIANSAAYGFLSEVTSVEKATSLLGEDVVANIALSNSAKDIFDKELTGYEGKAGSLWRHDLRVAIASQKVASCAKNDTMQPETAFTAGLLHDIGKAVLSNFLGNTSKVIVEAIDKGKLKGFPDAEQRLLGTDHAEVGYQLARHWKLPAVLCDVIRYHHQPRLADALTKPYAYATHLGDMMAMLAGCGTGADTLCYPLDKDYEQHFNLMKNQLPLLMLEIDEAYAKVSRAIHPEEEPDS